MSRLTYLILAIAAVAIALLPHPSYSQPPAPAAVATIKTTARIVVVDVVVTDKNQKPVHNLKQSDFNVHEDGTPQVITHFEEHIYNPHSPPVERLPPTPPGIFTNFSPNSPSDAVNIILLDSLNTPLTDQSNVRSQLKEYLNTAKPGVPTAIFGLTSHLILLQGFTSDPELLKTIVNKKNLTASALLDNPVATASQGTMSDQLTDLLSNDPNFAELIANMQQFEASSQTAQLEARVDYTLEALNLLARYLSGLPGRKNLIWFSGSFPLNVLADENIERPFTTVANYDEELRETSRLLTAAQVAVYPVNVRGLYNNPSLSASNSGTKITRSPNAVSDDQAVFTQQTAAEDATMSNIAEQTGGRAFINTNGFSQAVATATDNGTNFYTLTYSPTDSAEDGRFRKIQVRLQHEGNTLAYRRGYYAAESIATGKARSPTQTPGTPATKGVPHPPPPLDPMRAAMMRGGPDPTQIIFKARILPVAATLEDTLVPGSRPNPNVKLSHGPYRRYQIDIAADPRDLLYSSTGDGSYRARLELRVYLYDQQGALIVESIGASQSDMTPETIKQLGAGGLPLHRQISVPEKGAYFLRIGLRDLTSDHLGAIEVPVASVKNLLPLGTPAPSSASAPTPTK